MAFEHKHLIDINEYSDTDIMTILETAKTLSEINQRKIKKVPTLKGLTVVNMFNEPSTRTRSSFELAEKRLSCDSLNFGGSSTSSVKGESLIDTVETLNAYKIDMIIVRDKHAGAPRIISEHTPASVVDAGDGKHQHPTQALLDLYTIWEHKHDFNGLKVGIVGDIGHSRVCGSLIPALKIMGAEVTVVGPATLMPACPEVLGADHVTPYLDDVLPELDVVYMLAHPARTPRWARRSRAFANTMSCSASRRSVSISCVPTHRVPPGPINRGVEFDSYMADHPERSVILEQVYAGICVRMAVLYLLLGGAE